MHEKVSWYSTARWQRKRASQLKKEPFCRYCRQVGKTSVATVADHVVPHKGDEELFWSGELQSLCRPCHDGAKRQQEATGNLRGCDVNGMPLDPRHHWQKAKPRGPPG